MEEEGTEVSRSYVGRRRENNAKLVRKGEELLTWSSGVAKASFRRIETVGNELEDDPTGKRRTPARERTRRWAGRVGRMVERLRWRAAKASEREMMGVGVGGVVGRGRRSCLIVE